jgi:hypothetical protein
MTDAPADKLTAIADELDNLSRSDSIGMPPTMQLRLIMRALPDLAARIRVVVRALWRK